jgi:rare lipoprotein A
MLVRVVGLRYSDNQTRRLAMAICVVPNVFSKSRIDIGTAVRFLIKFQRGPYARLRATWPDQPICPQRKIHRGCHMVPTHFSWNHSGNPYRDLAGPRPLKNSAFCRIRNSVSVRRECIRVALALMSILLAASCATQRESIQPSLAAPAQAAPAQVLSMPVRPRTGARTTNTVRASYQGNSTAGDRTASGERYDPDDLTAASSTLPLGSSVMVTDPATGRSVKVRINDRGPRHHGRSLDLSRRAAEEIGMMNKGVARVKIKRVDSEPAKSEPPSSSAGSAATPKS